MDVKVIGLDESGKFGDNQIFFGQVELEEDFEADIFINNIMNTKNFFYKKEELRGWDSKKKVSICHSIMNKDLIRLHLFKLNPIEQNKIFADIFRYQANFLYHEREKLIEIYKGIKEIKDLSGIIAQFYHYRKPQYLPDFCIKSYSYLYIINRYCMKNINQEFLQRKDALIKVQIDGGNLFSYWWYDFITNKDKKEGLEEKIFINGIAHGDEYYLSLNLADLFSQTFHESPHNFFTYKIEDIIYDFNDLNISQDIFYEKFWGYLKNFYFKNRLLFIGNSEAFIIIPHLLHFKKRSIIYEPFRIKKNIEDYFRYFNIGPIEKNLVIHSKKLSKEDKSSIDYCQDLGLKIQCVDEFKDHYIDFCNYIQEASKYYDPETQRKVNDVLDKYKNYF